MAMIMNSSSMQILGVTVMAVFLGAMATPLASAEPSVSPLMNIYVISGQDGISGRMPVPVASSASTPGKVSFSGFTNTTITDGGGAALFVSQGVSRGTAYVVISFSDTNSQGTSKIATVMARVSNSGGEGNDESNDGSKNDNGGLWAAVIHADYAPTSNPVHLGDGFFLNYTSDLSGQYAGLAKSIAQVGLTYSHSAETKLRTLGGYYLVLAHEISKMKGMVPHELLRSDVKASVAIASDDWLTCLEAIGFLAAASAAFIGSCVTPAVIAVLDCVGAIAALAAAAAFFGQSCPG